MIAKKPPETAQAMLLTPGAGSSADHSSLVAIEAAMAPLPVDRVDFPYRKEGRRAPDRAPKLIASLRADAEALVARVGADPHRVVYGGRSMGGRMCSMAIAQGMPAAGLVLISYPLHPPGKPENLRTAHFPDLRVPCLFVSGERDAFGKPDEFDAHVGEIPGRVTQVWIPKAGHDLKNKDELIVDAILAWFDAEGLRRP